MLTRRLVRGRDGQKRCYVGVAFRPRPGSDLAPPRWPRPASAPAPTITWVEENRGTSPPCVVRVRVRVRLLTLKRCDQTPAQDGSERVT